MDNLECSEKKYTDQDMIDFHNYVNFNFMASEKDLQKWISKKEHMNELKMHFRRILYDPNACVVGMRDFEKWFVAYCHKYI